ncbi:MAG: tryptophan--tRNA ligase [Candidatus Cloacimonetes bacterium]|nr:tryptophan--tRNA ligase [Candidatus Cloacimonadota bacterium]
MKPVILSGIQPSGKINIGHYLGALKNWVLLQEQYECLFMVVDLHSITVRQDPKVLRERVLSFVALYLACGIDPDRSTIFIQSSVLEHAQLGWILNCHTGLGELQRMTQFKDKSSRQESVQAGLLNYPTLMAADILLYGTALVPVGEDQKQHLELTRDLAIRMNHLYGEDLFVVPEPFIPQVGARIMSLQQPERKMSKSDPLENASLNLLDSQSMIEKKCKSAVTDSGSVIRFDPANQPGVSNLLTIQSAISGVSINDLVSNYSGKMYGHLKVDTARIVNELLNPIRERYETLRSSEDELLELMAKHAIRARKKAGATLRRVQDALGFVPV